MEANMQSESGRVEESDAILPQETATSADTHKCDASESSTKCH